MYLFHEGIVVYLVFWDLDLMVALNWLDSGYVLTYTIFDSHRSYMFCPAHHCFDTSCSSDQAYPLLWIIGVSIAKMSMIDLPLCLFVEVVGFFLTSQWCLQNSEMVFEMNLIVHLQYRLLVPLDISVVWIELFTVILEITTCVREITFLSLLPQKWLDSSYVLTCTNFW